MIRSGFLELGKETTEQRQPREPESEAANAAPNNEDVTWATGTIALGSWPGMVTEKAGQGARPSALITGSGLHAWGVPERLRRGKARGHGSPSPEARLAPLASQAQDPERGGRWESDVISSASASPGKGRR